MEMTGANNTGDMEQTQCSGTGPEVGSSLRKFCPPT